MKGGSSRAYMAMAAAATAMLRQFRSGYQADAFRYRAGKQLAKIAGGGRIRGKRWKRPNGPKECARRIRQGIAGTCYEHGGQYPSYQCDDPIWGFLPTCFRVRHHWKGKW